MEKFIFYHCPICNTILTRSSDVTEVPICCGEPMERLVAQTADSSTEKHVPVISLEKEGEVKVVVGSTLHPMLPKHYITRIHLVTTKGMKDAFLGPSSEPMAVFKLEEGEEVIGAYEYCNIHGLWYGELKKD